MESRFATWATPLIVVAGVVVLLVLAVFLINREDASSVAKAAETAMVADNALGVVSAIRTATSYATAFENAADGNRGTLDLLRDVDSASTELVDRVDRLLALAEIDDIEESLGVFLTATTDVAAALANGSRDVEQAFIAQGKAMNNLVEELLMVRDENVRLVLVAGEDVGKAATAVRFLVLLIIPLAVIVSLWRVQRRFSEQKVMAAEVEKQRRIAESKDAFVADVSHELRTPLTGIYGFAVSLEEHADNFNELQRELLGLIITESAELARMVDDLVAIGRIDAGAVAYSMTEVDVADSVEQVIKPFQRLGISFEHDSEGLTVFADEARFRQILRNLLSNAVKYGRGEIAVAAYRSGPNTTIEVIDDGPGVPDHVAERLFQRYVHAEGSGVVEGSVGLGLAIARSFVRGMGGTLTYSREDGLTVFQLTLSRSKVDQVSEELSVAAV